MTPLQLELTRLIGKKELTFGCLVKFIGCEVGQFVSVVKNHKDYALAVPCDLYHIMVHGKMKEFRVNEDPDILNHPATLPDFHRFMNEKFDDCWFQEKTEIIYPIMSVVSRHTVQKTSEKRIPYDSSKDLLDQEASTLEQIISLIKST